MSAYKLIGTYASDKSSRHDSALMELATQALAIEEQEKYRSLVTRGTLEHSEVRVSQFDRYLTLTFASPGKLKGFIERFKARQAYYDDVLRYQTMAQICEGRGIHFPPYPEA